MKFSVISGSHRNNSNSLKVSKFIASQIEATKSHTANIIDCAHLDLPVWSEEAWDPESKLTQQWKPISSELQSSDGIAIIVPEWAGTVPPLLKNLLLFCTGKELGHKPVLLCGVSTGLGGTYPLVELRVASYKNTQMVFLPEQIIVRNAGEVLNGKETANESDQRIRKRIRYAVDLLGEYAGALCAVRDSGVVNFKDFPNGM